MTGTISFGGIGSGMDTEGIVTGLVKADSGTLNALTSRANDTDSAVSTLSNIGSLLSNLRTSVQALADTRDVGSYTATSSASAIAVSANGAALPGAYDIDVLALAKEQRNYSATFSSSTDALNQSGHLTLSVGSKTGPDIAINSTDTLNDIADKINGAGLRVSASVFYDGSNYRLQVRGLDTGAANAITFDEKDGLNLGFLDAGSKVQSAQDSKVKIDGFTVSRPTNQVVGAIQGVTLALTQETTSPVTVRVASDPSALQSKLQSVVSAYNAVVSKVHLSAGYGSTAGNVAELKGDSTLRTVLGQLSNAVLTQVKDSGTYGTLGSLGVSLNKDGSLSLDSTKLSTAVSKDPASVAAVLAGPSGGKGIMDIIGDLADSITSSKGLLSVREDSLSSRAKLLRDQATREQDRLDHYAESLRKQFTQMDSTVANYNSQAQYIAQLAKNT
jgi:flagellar hook-associated protein 2